MKPRILVAGLGETGSELARKLLLNWDVIAIDLEQAPLDALRAGCVEPEALHLVRGDATSSVVMKKADPEGAYAAVACTGSDEMNREALRIAGEMFGIKNRLALMYTLDWEERYGEGDIEVVSQDHACAAVLESRIARGQKVPVDVGLGEGEILEVEVLPNSSVSGTSLSELHPKRWLVGAIYRRGKLVVPHGETTIQTGDRVLLIGDPEILPSIATLIRTGESEFPLQHGSHLVTIHGPRTAQILEEAAWLIENTRAGKLEAIACRADEARLEDMASWCEEHRIPCEFSCSASEAMPSLVHEASRRDVGILILPAEPLGLLASLGLGRSRLVRTMDLVSSPVLVSRNSFPYRRVLLVLAELPFHGGAAQMAIDLVRMVKAQLTLGVVHQPEIVVGAELKEEVEKRMHEIEHLAGMYHVQLEQVTMSGNPIREMVSASREYDLMILPYPRRKKAFLTRPDVGMNLIHKAHCSVMVLPH